MKGMQRYKEYLLILGIVFFHFAGNSLWYRLQSNDLMMNRGEAIHFLAARDKIQKIGNESLWQILRGSHAPLPPSGSG
jgi:hypothetical protein